MELYYISSPILKFLRVCILLHFRYANRAKNIKNKPKINEDPKDALLRAYQEEIAKLKQLLMEKMPEGINQGDQSFSIIFLTIYEY